MEYVPAKHQARVIPVQKTEITVEGRACRIALLSLRPTSSTSKSIGSNDRFVPMTSQTDLSLTQSRRMEIA